MSRPRLARARDALMRPPGIPRLGTRLYRRLYWLRRDAPILYRLGWKPTMLYAGTGGMGDELLCTAALTEFRRRGVSNLIVLARHPELFHGHPANPTILPTDYTIVQTAENWNLPLHRPCEWQGNDPRDEDRQLPPRDHVIAENCRAAGLTGTIALRPYLALKETERADGLIQPGQVVIQSSGVGAKYHYSNKEWFVERFQAVADALRGDFPLVQLGSTRDPLLSGVIDLRGRTSIRQSASILAAARFLVGPEGFLMHLARAVDTRSVIVFGGHTRPDQIGYPCNENLYRAVTCAPCWRKTRCDFDHVCMQEIGVADVVAAARRVAARADSPLETTTLPL